MMMMLLLLMMIMMMMMMIIIMPFGRLLFILAAIRDAIPDSFCAASKIIRDRASVHNQIKNGCGGAISVTEQS